MDRAEDATGPFAEGRIDLTLQQHLLPRTRWFGGMVHAEDEAFTVGEEDARHNALGEQRGEQPLHVLLAVDALDVAEPVVAGAQLGARLLDDQAAVALDNS